MGARVAILSSNFWPEQTGTSQVVGEFASYFASRGIEVSVATAMPFYPQWRIWDQYRGRLWHTERLGPMRVLRSWHFVSAAPSTITRLLHEISLSLFEFDAGAMVLTGYHYQWNTTFLLIIGLVIALIAVVAVALIIRMRKRRAGGWPPPQQQGSPPWPPQG